MLVGKLLGVIVKTFFFPYESNIKAGLWLRGPGADRRVDGGEALAELERSDGTPSTAQNFYHFSVLQHKNGPRLSGTSKSGVSEGKIGSFMMTISKGNEFLSRIMC